MTQAVGLSWAARKKKTDEVCSVYFGEGATSSNDFHTALNFAGVFKTPTVFLCRNNQWAISVPSDNQTASESFAQKAVAYGMPGVRVDGNDALATWKIVREAVDRAAKGQGPTLIEMVTYRIGGHSTSDDPRAYRMQSEVDSWQRTDPLLRLKRHLEEKNEWNEVKEETLRAETEAELKACIKNAEAKAKPALSTMFEGVFEEQPWHLKEQSDACVNGPRAKAHH